MPHINPAVQAGGAAAHLELTWKRWRASRGLPDGTDPVAAYVGYAPEDPMGQARVIIGVDAAEALLFAEMISYLIASRPLDHPGASSGQGLSGNGTGDTRTSAGRHGDDHEYNGRVSSRLSSWDLAVPPPDTAEAERPIMRNSPDPIATIAVSQQPVWPFG